MEEENQVFGKDAEAVDSNINLESEDFYFYHQNKEEAKKNIDSSSADLSDFIDSLIQDVPAPTDEEINFGIEKILERTHPEEAKNKVSKRKKLTFKVLFIAALLSILSFSGLYVVGSSHNISIENGFVSFAKDTIQIVFFGEEKEEYITVDALLADLEAHGYDDILFPQEFINNYDEYKVSVPEYINQYTKQVNFTISDETDSYLFFIYDYEERKETDFVSVDNMKSIVVGDTYIYISQFNKEATIDFVYDKRYFYIISSIPYSDMVKIAETIK